MADKVEFQMEDLLRKAESRAIGTAGSQPRARKIRNVTFKRVTALAAKVRAAHEQMGDSRCGRRARRGLARFLDAADQALRNYVYGGVDILSAMQEAGIDAKPLPELPAPAAVKGK